MFIKDKIKFIRTNQVVLVDTPDGVDRAFHLKPVEKLERFC